MEISTLQEYIALVRIGSYQRASQALSLSPSVLFKHIKKVENELGTELFSRDSGKIRLTQTGEFFLQYAIRNVNIHREMENELHSSAQQCLRIGLLQTYYQYNIIRFLSAFSAQNPDCMLDIQEAENNQEDLLHADALDLIFTRYSALSAPQKDLKEILCFRDPLVAVFPAGHPLAGFRSVAPEHLRHESITLPGSGAVAEAFHALCEQADINIRIPFFMQREESQIDMVNKLHLCAIMTRKSAENYLSPKLRIVPLYPEVDINISLMYPVDITLRTPAFRFISLVSSHQGGLFYGH